MRNCLGRTEASCVWNQMQAARHDLETRGRETIQCILFYAGFVLWRMGRKMVSCLVEMRGLEIVKCMFVYAEFVQCWRMGRNHG